MYYYCICYIIYILLIVVGYMIILMKIFLFIYYRVIKKNFLLNWLFWMLIGYFDLILKIEIDRKNILNLKMCVNFFILDIYSYFVE